MPQSHREAPISALPFRLHRCGKVCPTDQLDRLLLFPGPHPKLLPIRHLKAITAAFGIWILEGVDRSERLLFAPVSFSLPYSNHKCQTFLFGAILLIHVGPILPLILAVDLMGPLKWMPPESFSCWINHSVSLQLEGDTGYFIHSTLLGGGSIFNMPLWL